MWQKHSEKYCTGDLFLRHENTVFPFTLSVHEFLATHILAHTFFVQKSKLKLAPAGRRLDDIIVIQEHL